VATYGDGQAHSFNGQTAEDKGGARRGRGKQDDCGDAEQKTGWHNQQSVNSEQRTETETLFAKICSPSLDLLRWTAALRTEVRNSRMKSAPESYRLERLDKF
jgi:hypothetical protein